MFVVVTNPNDLKTAVLNHYSFAYPLNSSHNFAGAIKEINRDGYHYAGGAFIMIGNTDFQIMHPEDYASSFSVGG